MVRQPERHAALAGHPDRAKWNARFGQGGLTRPHPLALSLAGRLPRGAKVLELASGPSGSALVLAEAGFEVVAADISDVALERLAGEATRRGVQLTCAHTDLAVGLPAGKFAAVLATHYWDAEVFARAAARVAPEGFLAWETFSPAEKRYRPDFRFCLGDDEPACHLPAGFVVESIEELDDGEHATRRFLARRTRGTRPTLSFAGRGRSVVRDEASGRWRFGPRKPTQLVERARHGHGEDLLIHGEAMDALLALQASHAGRFRLCYIDPPFNTGQDFGAYDDRADHAVWLAAMEERLRATRDLLVDGGFLVVHLNEVELGHLRVLLDESWGERVAQIVWQRSPDRTVLGQGNTLIPDHAEYLLVYAKGSAPADWQRPQRELDFPAKTLGTYRHRLVPSATSTLVDELVDGAGERVAIFRHAGYSRVRVAVDELRATAVAHLGELTRTTNQQEESTFQQKLLARMREPDVLYRAEFVQARGKHRGPRARHYLNGNVVLWLRDVARVDGERLVRVADLDNLWNDIAVTGVADEGGVSFRRGKKPEQLLTRVIESFSRPGDWVLDFFAGSGTTGAVAARLGRRFVLVEAGEHARTHCEPRLLREKASFRVLEI